MGKKKGLSFDSPFFLCDCFELAKLISLLLFVLATYFNVFVCCFDLVHQLF